MEAEEKWCRESERMEVERGGRCRESACGNRGDVVEEK